MFSEEICKKIGKGLTKNQTLYGLHMAGNCCSVDGLGFIVIDEAITLAFLEKLKEQDPSNPPPASSRKEDLTMYDSPKKEFLFHRMEGTRPVIKKRVNMPETVKLPQINIPSITRKGL
jgi:hypothetical protein